jgi:uncharacterized membrane protein YwzB
MTLIKLIITVVGDIISIALGTALADFIIKWLNGDK